ncbi:MAG TPA: Uma2 family endonuclease [Planctomycetota bacterium]|nr:Uma2 family endonuclease [Planctomycetota bacterium]
MAVTALRRHSNTDRIDTLKDLVKRLGGVPLSRILFDPPPGTATEEDVIRYVDGDDKRLVELVDGVLVEKTMGWFEGCVAAMIIHIVREYLDKHDLGMITGADGTLRLMPGLVRIPDVAFISWNRFPDQELPVEPLPDLAPDLAIEVLSKGNTKREMERKTREYFEAGAKLVWLVDIKKKVVDVYTSPKEFTRLSETEPLDGGKVLPGFKTTLREILQRASGGRKFRSKK